MLSLQEISHTVYIDENLYKKIHQYRKSFIIYEESICPIYFFLKVKALIRNI